MQRWETGALILTTTTARVTVSQSLGTAGSPPAPTRPSACGGRASHTGVLVPGSVQLPGRPAETRGLSALGRATAPFGKLSGQQSSRGLQAGGLPAVPRPHLAPGQPPPQLNVLFGLAPHVVQKSRFLP